MPTHSSTRFAFFVFTKCRYTGTCGKFLGPEWAEIVQNKLIKDWDDWRLHSEIPKQGN